MKKKIFILSILIIPLLLTGCGKDKKLECETVNEENLGNFKTVLIYNGKTLKSGYVLYKFDYSDVITSDSQLDVLKEQNFCDNMVPALRSSTEVFSDTVGECTEDWTGKVLKVKIYFNARKLNKKSNFKSIKAAKKELEYGDAMTCKIK